MSADLNCPYCDAEVEINHDDGFGYTEGVLHQQQCPQCKKYFVFETSISFYYEPSAADCLNTGDHHYRQTHTFPAEFTKMRCDLCGKERNPTPPEWEEILKETERREK